MLIVMLLMLLLPGIGLAQSKEAAEVTLFEGQGLMQALVGAGYDFRLYTELRKVTPDGDAVECGSPSKFEIRSMHPQILWLPAGAKVNQTRLKQCLAVENELFGNKQTIVHQPTQKPRAVRIPVPKPAPAPPVATPKKQPAPKREISEARPTAPANKQPSPKSAPVPAPKVQTKVLDQKSLAELEKTMRTDMGKTTRLVPPAPAPKKAALPAKMAGEIEKETLGQKAGEPKVQVKVPVPAQPVEKKPITVLPKTQRPDPLLAAYNSRIAYQKRELAEVAKRAAKKEADAARNSEIRWAADKTAKSPRDLPFDWKPTLVFSGIGMAILVCFGIALKLRAYQENKMQQEIAEAAKLQAIYANPPAQDASQVISPREARRLVVDHPAGPLTTKQVDEAAHILAKARGLRLVDSEQQHKAS